MAVSVCMYVYTVMLILMLGALIGCAAERECHECYGICCPRPDDPDDHTICTRNNGKAGCMSKIAFAGIFIGVFGGLLLIGLIIGVTCCILVKKKIIMCVKVGPGRYTCMSQSKAERYRARQEAIDAMVAQYAAGAAATNQENQREAQYKQQYG